MAWFWRSLAMVYSTTENSIREIEVNSFATRLVTDNADGGPGNLVLIICGERHCRAYVAIAKALLARGYLSLIKSRHSQGRQDRGCSSNNVLVEPKNFTCALLWFSRMIE